MSVTQTGEEGDGREEGKREMQDTVFIPDNMGFRAESAHGARAKMCGSQGRLK